MEKESLWDRFILYRIGGRNMEEWGEALLIMAYLLCVFGACVVSGMYEEAKP